jgi:hypothetical protein
MRLKLLGILSVCLLLLSCSKDETVAPNDEKHAVTFTVSPFSQQITDITNTKALNESIGYLNCLIFNSSGTMVKQISQVSTNANFGVIADQLNSGCYTIYFLGTKKQPNHINTTSSDGCEIYYDLSQEPIYDSFYKKVILTVEKNSIAQNVVLDRFVSYVEVVITDVMPSYAKKVVMNIENEYCIFKFNTGETSSIPTPVNSEKMVASTDMGKANFTTGTFVLNTYNPLTINIKVYDVDNKIIAEKKVSNVTCIKNRKTILSGKLFDGIGPSSTSLTVSLNSNFTEPLNVTF